MNSINDLFFIPVGDLQGMKADDVWMVYSPLAESMILVYPHEATSIFQYAGGHDTHINPELKEAADALMTYLPIENRNDQIRSVRDFVTLYVLPNYVCNFSCSYCFAAHGRDKQRMDIDKLRSMISWMLDPDRTDNRNIYITFLGGGEPILSYEVIKEGIEYGNALASDRGFTIIWSVVTNGSLVSDDMLDFFKSQNVTVRYSFEVIREIQESQRGNYDKVHQSILSACNKGMNPVVRSMITPLNVGRLSEMVRIIADNYSGVKLFKIDPVTDSAYGSDLLKMEDFYRKFNEEYIEAKEIGEELGIEVQCVTERNLDSVISRFCAGEISLNAYGEITACHRISSPKEDGYETMLYGRVTELGVEMDHEKFRDITSDKVDTKSECKECFLKYNCAGGCRAQNDQYTPEMQKIVCHYSRELSRRILFDRLMAQQ